MNFNIIIMSSQSRLYGKSILSSKRVNIYITESSE